MKYETENWTYVEAAQYGAKRTNDVRLIVVHDMEFPERKDTAEVIAHDFATRTKKNAASAHICVDSDSIIQCVKDSYVAYAAPGANHDGIQIELAGFGAQTLKSWMDEYGWMLLNRAADAAAQYCLKYDIPAIRLTDAELKAGKKGIVGHDQVTRVYKQSDHTDPGNNFPWIYFVTAVETFRRARA